MCSSLFGSRLLLSKCFQNSIILRNFSLSGVELGRASREPYDKRFGLHVLDAGPDNPGGTIELQERLMRESPDMPQRPGVYGLDGKFHFVPELVPEFVVPDLTGFKLKPYVDYGVKEIIQQEFTPYELFSCTYAKDIIKDYNDGKISLEEVEKRAEKMMEKNK